MSDHERRPWIGYFVPAALAGIVTAALALERRRPRRSRIAVVPAAAPPPAGSAPAGETGKEGESDRGDAGADDEPLLSPTWFWISHFSFFVLLMGVITTGLVMRGIRRYPPETTWHVHGGDADRGRGAIVAHGCGGCHVIPGIRNATGRVGPQLHGFSEQMYIAGQLPNTPENLVSWLQNSQKHAPGTAMPNLAIDEPTARDMAAYLYRK